ncbi:MAG: hypothetical protein CVU38_00065 [Chloroflexi bacterium HGW-Chloroflexi-1]|nr:MAG: hypothetical protein CVU38_00065 [Chloroflexi bacterium HGW-Chloroflexi-1]
MDQAMQELNQKIDLLTAQVQFLTGQAQIAERQRQERAELMRDVMPIVNDAYRLTVDQLEEVEQYVDLGDLLRLLKRLLHNGRNIEQMLDQMESLMGLAETIGPLTDAVFAKAVDTLAEFEHKGYFTFARNSLQLMDGVVAAFDEGAPAHVSLLALLRQMQDPDVRRGLALTVRVLRAVGAHVGDGVTG